MDVWVERSGDEGKAENLIEILPHYDNIGALQQSALNGCHLTPASTITRNAVKFPAEMTSSQPAS